LSAMGTATLSAFESDEKGRGAIFICALSSVPGASIPLQTHKQREIQNRRII
jgi:hypothetical protein